MVWSSVFYIVSGDIMKSLNWDVISGVFEPVLCRETPWITLKKANDGYPTQNWLKNATNEISIQEFHNVTRHYVKDTGLVQTYIKGLISGLGLRQSTQANL